MVTAPLDRFAGCLVGQALGDALGFVVEGQGAALCAAYADLVVRARRSAGWARAPFATGQYSDDTQLARELAASLVERRGFDAPDYARRIAAIFVDGRVVGRGLSTEAAALRLAAGVPWQQAGTPPPSAGNGSAMRVAPVGLLHAHDLARLQTDATEQGRITHADPRCGAGARVVARAVAAALRGELGDAGTLCTELADGCAADDAALAAALRRLPSLLAAPPERAAWQIAPVGLPDGADTAVAAIAPFVTPSVLWSLYAALRHADDYVEAIAVAIGVGGDVDTTAAMTGAIVGAAVGLHGLPPQQARLVHDRGALGYDELCALGAGLHALVRARA